MERLPIYELRDAIISAARERPRLIISAPTGSGKSTQVPQMLLDSGLLGDGQVVVLQPRRLAARMLAARVARERGVELGGEVGYQIRFDNVTSPKTRIRFVTEGVLLRQMIQDAELAGVSAILFDEFHERHLYGDITLAQALGRQAAGRPDLKLLVMSATLDIASLETCLAPCQVLESQGRSFPVETRYAENPGYLDRRPIWEQAAEAFAGYVNSGGEGDVLVFMPGGYEISQTLNALRHTDEAKGFVLLPLHGELPPREQDAAVERYDRRKVVVATNVAETSLTIDGIRCVIDSGLARIPRYDPLRGINTLLIEKISQASADQRAGRSGRTAPGVCLRLWSREEHGHRPAREMPEIQRLELSEVVLALTASGARDLRTFPWLEPPPELALNHAEELLKDLGALAARAGGLEITPLGRRMLAFPLHPRYARMLLAAREYGCARQACLVAALTQGRDLLLRNVDRATAEARADLLGEGAASDFWVLMRAWNYAMKNEFRLEACRRLGIHLVTARQIGPLFQQFLEIARREGLDIEPRQVPDEALQKCILIGFSDRLARRLDGGTLRCELVRGRRGLLARESAVGKAGLLVAAEIREIEGKDKTTQTLLSLATAVQEDWLAELFPADLECITRVFFDSVARRVCAEEQTRFRGLALSARRVEPPPLAEASRLLAEEVAKGRLTLTQWDHAVEQWILRLNLLSQWCPEFQLPAIHEEDRRHLLEQICSEAFTYKEIKDRPVLRTVKSWVSPAQQELVEKHAPERLSLANGKNPRVTYASGAPPHISLRIQELYDVTASPRIALGRVPVVAHILAPNMRPVQVTQDLSGFWREHYPKLKLELRRRYPKHVWR